MIQEAIEILKKYNLVYALVGSRVTCDPPPTDTDQDILVYSVQLDNVFKEFLNAGFSVDGSTPIPPEQYISGRETFQSFSAEDCNVIFTSDAEFYARFLQATHIAKNLNLLEKADRIKLFQGVLYKNYI